MNYKDFGLPADGKAARVKMMRQFQIAKQRIDKGVKNANDYAICFGDTPESWTATWERIAAKKALK